ncbi:MAG TPA: dTMP kinase [Candidatus Kapabacteria bacterium]|nr:dTMP kinase [Candidatus Kapabacteria bacterium]
MFITFEGIDGCGKSTQLKLVNEYFISKGIKTLLIREPGGTNFSEKIREILLSHSSDMTNISELLLFASARNSLVSNVIEPAISNNIVVISDRFYDSTTAYQGFGRGLDLKQVEAINQIATNGLKPDLTFYLKLTVEEANQRSKYRQKDRIEDAGNHFFENVIIGYDTIADTEPERVKVIPAKNSISHTNKLILEIIKNFENNEIH